MLTADLATLNFETMDWMKKVLFYTDEFRFFQDLTDHKKNNSVIQEQVHRDIDLKMNTMIDRLLRLTKDLTAHEKYLSIVIKDENDTKHPNFREKHGQLARRIIKLDEHVLVSKKEIYPFLLTKHPKQRHGFPI